MEATENPRALPLGLGLPTLSERLCEIAGKVLKVLMGVDVLLLAMLALPCGYAHDSAT